MLTDRIASTKKDNFALGTFSKSVIGLITEPTVKPDK